MLDLNDAPLIHGYTNSKQINPFVMILCQTLGVNDIKTQESSINENTINHYLSQDFTNTLLYFLNKRIDRLPM